MRSKYNKRILGLFLMVALIAVASPGQAAEAFDPDQFLRKASVKAELAKITNDDQAQGLMRTHFVSAAGNTNQLFGFAAALAGGDYVEQIETIMEVPVQQWNFSRGAMGSYDLINVRKIVMQNKTTSLFGSVKDNMGHLATALSVFSIMNDAYAGLGGNSTAKLKAILGTYDLVSGYWAKRIGWGSLGNAMIGVGIINYTLNKFMSTAIGTYTDFWWNAYTAYLDKKYPQMVTGNDSWAALVKSGGQAALERRLDEFWDDPLGYATNYYATPGIINRSWHADLQSKHKFAAQFYKERLHITLKTFFQNQAADAEARAAIEARQAHDLLMSNLNDLAMLKMAIDDAESNSEEMDRILAIRPPASTIQVDESVTFTTLFLYEDASEVSATGQTAFSGAASGPVFNATEAGTFTITATCEGLTADAVVIVKEKDEEDDTDDEEEDLDDAIDEIKGDEEEEGEDACGVPAISEAQGTLAGLISRVQSLSSVVTMYQTKFDKELADRAADPCGNSLLAYCYTSARDAAGDLDFLVDEIREKATSLIMTIALCPGAVDAFGQPVNISGVIKDLAGAGTARGEAESALASMEARLGDNGCDEDEFADLADQFTEEGQDPDEMQDGGTMGEIGGDGVDNDQDGQQEEGWAEVYGKNVTIVVYDSGNWADDVFGLSVSGIGYLGLTPAGGLRSFGVNLEPGTYTATVTVVMAPDNEGTFTAFVVENGERIGELSTGSPAPPVGASLGMTFTVTGN